MVAPWRWPWRWWRIYWYRRCIGRCVVCGGARVKREGPWVAPLAYACGWCNKRVQHGMNYGMGAEKLRALLLEGR